MKYLIIILAFIGAMHLAGVASDQKREMLTPQPPEYIETHKLTINHDENTCSDNSEYFDIYFKVVYVASTTDFAGQWSPQDRVISLNEEGGRDIDTVAHEVSHMVDTVMESHHISDDHFEAYLQGVYTLCVWQIVEADMYSGTFRFLR